eukprot:TRINITY_DN3603_c0_g1_i1.p1 TRINITY_DN3603_c0_g1~~TRINITY_DN3603_c0_g1_i1.p1  ORF type:complete len:435 (+),score=88.52 TRINITY_DN3603_c0_g1_i1:80-1384(+)
MVIGTLLFGSVLLLTFSPRSARGQNSSAKNSEGNEIRDGPSPSIIGSIDNVFESVKNYDSNRCIERMICEYMMPKTDEEGLSDKPIRGGVPFGPVPSFSGSQFPQGRPPPGFPQSQQQFVNGGFPSLSQGQQQQGFGGPQQGQFGALPPQGQFGGQFGAPPQGQFGGQFAPPPQGQFGGQFGAPPQGQFGALPQGQFGAPPQGQFGAGQFGAPPQQGQFGPGQFGRPSRPQQEGLLGLFSSLVGKKRRRRRKRQTNLQGNILRLLKATGLDSMNAYPYIRAGLIGQASDPLVRSGNSCARLYRQCPTEPDRLLNYFNNHNGGIINNVQPSVDNEIGPIVSAIISDLAEQNGAGGGSNNAGGGLLSSAGSLLSSYLSGGNSGGNTLLNSLSGGSGSAGSSSGLLSSFLQSESGLLNGAVNAITDYIHGPGPNGKK